MKFIRAITRLAAVLPTVVAVQAVVAQSPSTVHEIERRLRVGQAHSAYEFALRRAGKEAGDSRFDLAFARAANAADHPEQAVFALERVLAVEPINHEARLELARAELKLGNASGAREALDTLLAQNPPEPIRREAVAWMRSVRDIAPRMTPARARPYAELKYGYDTNVNNASSLTGVDAYTSQQVTSTTALRDRFAQLDLGVDGEKPLGANAFLFGNLMGSIRDNDDSDTYDSRFYDARIGALYAEPRHSLRLTGQWQRLDLDKADYRRLKLLVPDWGIQLNTWNQIFLFGQFGQLHYPQQRERDVDLTLGGIAWIARLDGGNQLSWSLYRAEETAGDDSAAIFRKHFGREYTGWRLRWQLQPVAAHTGYLSVGTQVAEHAAREPTFLVIRDDRLRTAEVGWHWKFVSSWTAKLELNYYKNLSNISLYEYSRTQTQISLRYDFF